MSGLEDVKAGDTVVMQDRNGSDLVSVDRVTPKWIVIQGRNFRKKDGEETGDHGFYHRSIHVPSAEELVALKSMRRRRYLVKFLRTFKTDEIKSDVLEAAVFLIKNGGCVM